MRATATSDEIHSHIHQVPGRLPRKQYCSRSLWPYSTSVSLSDSRLSLQWPLSSSDMLYWSLEFEEEHIAVQEQWRRKYLPALKSTLDLSGAHHLPTNLHRVTFHSYPRFYMQQAWHLPKWEGELACLKDIGSVGRGQRGRFETFRLGLIHLRS